MKKMMLFLCFVAYSLSYVNAQYFYPPPYERCYPMLMKSHHFYNKPGVYTDMLELTTVPSVTSPSNANARVVQYEFRYSILSNHKLRIQFGGASSSVWIKQYHIGNPSAGLIRSYFGPTLVTGYEIEINCGSYQDPFFMVEIQVPDLNYGGGHMLWINAWYEEK